MKQAVILAGGKGTRLKSRLNGRPKPLVDIGGKPLLERQLDLLHLAGHTHAIILVNYQADQIADFCNNYSQDMDIRCIDDGEPKGTAGAVLSIIDQLAEQFLVVYGDTLFEIDFARFEAFHEKVGATGTLFVHPNDHPHDSDIVDVDPAGRINCFHSYPHPPNRYLPNLVNAALYLLNRDALVGRSLPNSEYDFGKHLFPELLSEGVELAAYNSPEYIKDVGTPERIDKAEADLLSGKVERSSLAHKQPIVFLDRDGTINHEVGHLHSPDQLDLIDNAASAIARLNKSEYRACIVTNQPVIARGDCDISTLNQIHNKLECELGLDRAFIDRIYFCPHHPDKGFDGEVPELKLDCDCRKPNTQMIQQAISDFNGDTERSWLIGDTTTDIETANNAGLRSILVSTGHGGNDGKYSSAPTHVAKDIGEAVQLILEHA